MCVAPCPTTAVLPGIKHCKGHSTMKHFTMKQGTALTYAVALTLPTETLPLFHGTLLQLSSCELAFRNTCSPHETAGRSGPCGHYSLFHRVMLHRVDWLFTFSRVFKANKRF